MKLKLSQIVNSQQGLSTLLTTSLPVKVAYKISRLVNAFQPELKIYEEQRIKLVKELGEATDEAKQEFKVKDENIAKFTEEMGKLNDVEVDIKFGDNEVEKIKLSDLGDIKLEAANLLSLDWLLENE